MKKTIDRKPLRLGRETIRELQRHELANVPGGIETGARCSCVGKGSGCDPPPE